MAKQAFAHHNGKVTLTLEHRPLSEKYVLMPRISSARYLLGLHALYVIKLSDVSYLIQCREQSQSQVRHVAFVSLLGHITALS
jgi:hypothetical protein